ncbi:CCGSCS motif protein [Photobacterium alginatilyticum]|uniref:CCGSCS motif protein n=1 Tax=Photobacterium alginatilyticum TaxID=1775171 RepID=A0ABW9YE63_9GAMM|nr:CCGSCS motif protein [Photobacterium alginatilyticum]NBI52062.1 CCGSCS motif protein [Photobacterium alginatilyticum]
MTISFKKFFKKTDDEQTKVGQEQTAEQAQPENEDKEKKGKHGEPGFCCGSCSQ